MVASQARKAARAAASKGGGSSSDQPAAAAASIVPAGFVDAPTKKRKSKAFAEEPPPAEVQEPPKKKKVKKEEANDAEEDDSLITNEWEKNDAEDEKPSSTAQFSGRKMTERISCTLFVGQLPFTASVSDIVKHFKHGGVTGKIGVRLLTNREDGSSRGMGFVELSTESDVHTALRLHKSPMEGRRINVERTVGGGGASEERKAKLGDLREKQGTQMKRQVQTMVEGILGKKQTQDQVPEEEISEDQVVAVCVEDLDERIMEFLGTVPTNVAEAALKEAKVHRPQRTHTVPWPRFIQCPLPCHVSSAECTALSHCAEPLR